ncbi:hypothetical protein D3Y57_02735 (plasmid) [Sphingomonas paeninsulae]|uniref:Uncharacterized protein n=1 Tax=Sphingomonas paeninsulae TaxID=2319844 RepID=A0A494T7Y8_SPHPE|nr:hypothetical protein D3Y57_02735 [Sphingomonas paeninsulae]
MALLVGAVTATVISSGVAWAQSTGLEDMVGARAGQAEGELQRRGYVSVRSEPGDDRSYAYWWNASKRQCVTISTMNGRYDAITATPGADCGRQENRQSQFRDGGNRPADNGYRPPDIGYRGGSQPQRQSPSYAQGPDRYQYNGRDVDLGLVCFGDGQRPGFATTYGWSWNSRTNRYDYGNRTEMTGQQFDASIMLQLWANGGRIKLPKKLIPPINSRGDGGWWDLYDVSAGPEIITAKYRLNGLNKPQITINRRSGQISIVGTAPYGFRGNCDLVDGQDHRRF